MRMRSLCALGALAVAIAGPGTAMPAPPRVISRAADAAPRGWKLLASAAGDLNRDGRPDLAVALAQVSPPVDDYQDDRPRILALYLRGKEGRLRLSALSRNILLPRNGGGVFGDPFQTLAIERGGVVLSHYGGSADRWGFTHRFRYQEGHWKLIGQTFIHHHTLTLESKEVDRNLTTGLIRVAERPAGENVPTSRRAYHELRAGPVASPPTIDAHLSRGEWPGLTVVLAGGDDVTVGRGNWRGPADLSARLGAVTHGGSLYLRAQVTDDRVILNADTVRLVDDRGRVVAPQVCRSRAGGRGYIWEGRYALAAVPRVQPPGEDEPLLRVSVEVLDADARGRNRATVLSTNRAGRRSSASVRLVPETGLPSLSRLRLPY